MEKKIFVNGTFDILHVGHLSLLFYAKSLGTVLHVGIDSDERVKQLKGQARPVNNQRERKEMLLALKPVDSVYIFNSATELENLIESISPDIMVIGSDWSGKKVIGDAFAKSLVFYDRIEPYSTTRTIQHIANR